MSQRWRLCVVLMFSAIASLSPGNSLGFDLKDFTQDTFSYCFPTAGELNASQKGRWADGVDTWKQRGIVSASEVNCALDPIDVAMNSIDGQGGVLARTTRNFLEHPVGVRFDSDETWNNTRLAPSCGEVDFWGLAAHEIGHIYGLGHAYPDTSPQSQFTTMADSSNNYSGTGCPQARLFRDLTSDDEAGIRYISTGQYLPSTSFELQTDCVSYIDCVDAQYWVLDSATIVCGDGNAYHGDCYGRITSLGTLNQGVRFDASGTHTFQLRINNRGSIGVTIRLRVRNAATGIDVLNSTCYITQTTTWELCSKNYTVNTGGVEKLVFWVEKETSGPTVWVDRIRGEGAGVG